MINIFLIYCSRGQSDKIIYFECNVFITMFENTTLKFRFSLQLFL